MGLKNASKKKEKRMCVFTEINSLKSAFYK